MKFNLKDQEIIATGGISATLAKLDAKAEPIRIADYLANFYDAKSLQEMLFQSICSVRESLGKQAIINSFIMTKTYCVLDMRASAETCYLTGEDDNPQVIMSYDIFNCSDNQKTKEMLFACLAQLIEYKIFSTTVKRFHWQLIYYLMGFDPIRAQTEKAEAKKLLGA